MTESFQILPADPVACVCCRLSGAACDVPFLSGVVTDLEKTAEGGRALRLHTGEGEKRRIVLPRGMATEWQTAILDRAFATRGQAESSVRAGFFHLAIEAGELRFTSQSLFVLEPDWLFSVSDATHFDFCDRQRLVSFYRTDSASLPMLRGTLVHQLFPRLWRGCEAEDLEAALAKAVEEQALKIGLAGLDPAEVISDSRAHLVRLKRWADGVRKQSELVSETFRLAPGWGLKGRIDAIWERAGVGPVILGELKTGRSKGRGAARAGTENGEAELGHIFQLVSYAAMLMGRDEINADPLHACLLYSGNPDAGGKLDIVRKVELTVDRLRDTVDIRNRLVLLEMGDPPAFKNSLAACNRCRCNIECETQARLAGHPDSRALEDAVWTRSAAAEVDEKDAACFKHYDSLVRDELTAVREDLSRLWKSAPETRVAGGRALRLRGKGRPDSMEAGEGRRAVWRYAIDGGNHSEFRAGDSVLMSDRAGPARGRAALGTITEAGPDEIAIAWESEPGLVPVWVDGYPDEKLTRRQLSSLFRFMGHSSRLKDVLIRGTRAPEFEPGSPAPENLLSPDTLKRLGGNARQLEAVRLALRAKDVMLVAGPPGSGKTMLIGALIEAIAKRPGEPRVLLVASTNRALDQALERVVPFMETGLSVVRLGGELAVADSIRPLTLAGLLRNAGSSKAAAAAGEVVRTARVVGVTASTLAGGAMEPVLGSFDWVVMDEASQMTVPLGLGAASYGERLVLIGDERQLPPIVRAEKKPAGEWPGLSVSLFELAKARLAGKGPVLVELERQYRMSEGVGAAPAAVWYDGRLTPGSAGVSGRMLAGLLNWEQHPMAAALDPGRPVLVADIPGSDRPRVNDDEASWVVAFMKALLACGAKPVAPDESDGMSVAVISPYHAQVARIRTLLGVSFPEQQARWRACVDTVDRFQGGEADVVVVSLCPPAEESEHLADPRRLNVALTRARAKVILLGDIRRLETYPVFRRLFEEYEKRWPDGAWRLIATSTL